MTAGDNHFEIILGGTGGQGLILASILLAEAAILEGKNVVQTQSYGIASRGGLSVAEVILDTGEIIFQKVLKPDCILVMTEEAAKKYEAWAEKGVTILYNGTLVRARRGPCFAGYPFTRAAIDLGIESGVNLLALGTMAVKTGVVKIGSLEQVIRKRFQESAVDTNLNLLAAGRDLALG